MADVTNDARPKVVVYTSEVLGAKLAGPAIRALRFAEALSAVAEVRLVSELQADLQHDDFEIIRAGGDDLLRQIEWADVLIMQSALLTMLPELKGTDTLVVADLYDPFLLEELQQDYFLGGTPDSNRTDFTVRVVNDMVRYADFIICASEKQRDLWLGQLSSQGRINVSTYRADPSLRSLVDVVPFGVDERAPVQESHGIRGVVDGISLTDKVIIWGGGIYDWFDPLTLIRAVGSLAERRDDLRLFFLSVAHPNPDIGTMRMASEAMELAKNLGLLGTSVFFNDQWVEHERRADYLLDADLGVSTHLDHLETAFSFRTRLLDYVWAGLPIINTTGDAFEPIITEGDLGAVVPPGDVDALAAAIETLLYDPDRLTATAARVRAAAPDLHWSRALAPLVAYCAAPYGAADSPRSGPIDEDATTAELRRRVASYEASSSWRLTAPLRALSQSIGRLRRR